MSGLPPTNELVLLGAPLRLRGGSKVRLRQIRAEDGQTLLRAFGRLSEESRYRRFLAPMPDLSSAMVSYLTQVDHQDHEAIVALEEPGGEGVGVARYVRDPARAYAAEAAVTVADDWQGRGLGTVLLEVLAARAREQGVRSFTALMLATNREMMDVFQTLGPVRVRDREAGTVEIETPIQEVGVPAALRKLLRLAAREDVAVPLYVAQREP